MFAFNASSSLSFPFTGVTLHWFAAAFSDERFADAFRNSAAAAVASAVVAAVLGTLFALGMAKISGPLRSILLGFVLVPAILPGLLLGIALTVFYHTIHFQLSLVAAIAGHVLIALPFVVLTMNARLENMDESYADAARDLGASPVRAFGDITWPLIRPTVVGAALLAMSVSLDEFIITFFTIGSGHTLPVMIWGMLRQGADPTINAIATVILFGSVALAMVAVRGSRLRL
jgi:spermidine/putrescine transport system permease protein